MLLVFMSAFFKTITFYAVVDGWDISKLNIGEAMKRAQVLDVGVQDQVFKQLSNMQPRPSIYDPDFIAANQFDRADNLIEGTKFEQYTQIRQDIRYVCTLLHVTNSLGGLKIGKWKFKSGSYSPR